MSQTNIAILGLGTVGGATLDIILRNHDLLWLKSAADIRVARVLERSVDKAIERGVPADCITQDFATILDDPSISIVVELMGGVEPARTYITQALRAGKSVVTANKELVAKHWAALDQAACEGGAGLYFEASCAGGIPIIRTLRTSMQANHILELLGIVNGTTNYILTRMSDEGLDYADVLADAQRLGYAEANPAADVEGMDAAYKLSILSSLAFCTYVPLSAIYREGISRITSADIANARDMGYVIKLLAIAKREGDRIEARVHPTLVPVDHPLTGVRGSFNAVWLRGDYADDIMLYGRGAGGAPTGSAVVSDIVTAATTKPVALPFDPSVVDPGIEFVSNFASKYYINLDAADQAGVLASVTAILARHNVSIVTINQRTAADGWAPVVLMTHQTFEQDMRAAIDEISKLSVVRSVTSLLRVL